MKDALALTALVTRETLAEYRLLRYSFELFHGVGHHWRLYCDTESFSSLSEAPNTECYLLKTLHLDPAATDHPKAAWLPKLAALEDVWASDRFSTVIYVDTDLVFAAPVLECVSSLEGEVLLTPHYFRSPRQEQDEQLWGIYNNGFIVMRCRGFVSWWREALLANPDKFADQQCLDQAPTRFKVGHLPETANYGAWRSPSGTQTFPHAQIPEGCLFLKVNMLTPSDSALDIVRKAFVSDLTRLSNSIGGTKRPVDAAFRQEHIFQKIFAIQCLQYFQVSKTAEHQALFSEILNQDQLGIYRSLLLNTAPAPAGPRDYVSPGFQTICLDKHFPEIQPVNVSNSPDEHLRYSDRRNTTVPVVNRDEAHILYNSALAFAGKHILEIGPWVGWSTGHLAAGGGMVDTVDPQLANEDVRRSIFQSLTSAGLIDRVALRAGRSPELLHELSINEKRRWSLIFIDGSAEHPDPLRDAAMSHEVAEQDAVILMHNAVFPAIGKGLEYLKSLGWSVALYCTAQIIGVAWRGETRPLNHVPDPALMREMPAHLKGFPVIGATQDAVPTAEDESSVITK